jgi:hypothetical protein
VEVLDRSVALSVAGGVIAGIAMLALLLGVVPYREITRAQRTAVPAFPTEKSETSPPPLGS